MFSNLLTTSLMIKVPYTSYEYIITSNINQQMHLYNFHLKTI